MKWPKVPAIHALSRLWNLMLIRGGLIDFQRGFQFLYRLVLPKRAECFSVWSSLDSGPALFPQKFCSRHRSSYGLSSKGPPFCYHFAVRS